MFEEFDGISLKLDETILIKAKPSKNALIITWISIPILLFVVYGLPLIVQLFKAWFSTSIKQAILGKEISTFSYAWENSIGGVSGFLKFLIVFPTVLLGIAWFILCVVLTYRHFRYSMAITQKRLIGKSGETKVSVSLKKIKNVYLEQSLWGKLLNYGTIVVNTTSETYNFKNIAFPQKIKRLLMEYASTYFAH